MSEHPEELRLVFEDNFDAAELDRNVWLPHYLPAGARAPRRRQRMRSGFVLAPDDSAEPGTLVPATMTHHSACRGFSPVYFSGPVGGTIGQQPYRDGLFVREQQQTFWGWTPEPATSRSAPAASSRSGRWSVSGSLVSRTNRNAQRRSASAKCSEMHW